MVVIESTSTDQPILMGRNWLGAMKLDWSKVMKECKDDSVVNELNGKTVLNFVKPSVEELKKQYAGVFDAAFGEIKNVEVELVLKENTTPVFCKPHNVPFSLRPAVDKELDNLVRNDVIYPVTKTDWATPIVVVPKADKSVRICGNFKITLNQCIRTDHYPLPNPDEIFAQIGDAKYFCKLDLASAYNQVKIKESSQALLTINTLRGLFRYKRLPYGISSAGSIFQSVMDKIMSGIQNAYCYLDDILLISHSPEEMVVLVHKVLTRLSEYGVKINETKSKFFQKSIVFLGHLLDGTGIHPSPELSRAIVEAPRPNDVTQLRSYLGLLNYYGKFLPNLSTLLYPLHQLLNNGVQWKWNDKCEEAFEKSRKLLLQNNVLMPFDPKLDILVTCDSSQYGVGAVMAHVLPDGSERPIAFASRTLSQSERKYAQIEREALAIVFAVKRFHVFLYGRKFRLVTDHKALIFILGPNKSIPTLSAARVQRWALILAAYQYELIYRKGSEISNADALSRLPCNYDQKEPEEINFFSTSYSLPITHKEIGLASKFDPILSKAMDYTLHGWPNHVSEELQPFTDKTHQLSVELNCLLWGTRVVIPPTHRKEILNLLHSEHPGESRMKSLARSYVWWPGMDKDIQRYVAECNVCQSTRKSVPVVPLQPWTWPSQNWQRLHLDFANFEGKDFLILVDSRTKWVELFYMSSKTTSLKTIERLRTCFAAYGLPQTIVTDGGPQFTSSEFKEFLTTNGIHHVLTPPYHPASNGLAERMVQTVKETFLKQLLHDQKNQPNRSIQHKIDNFLFTYRNTPHSITGCTPSEMFLKMKPRTPLSLLKPNLSADMNRKQEVIKNSADNRRGSTRMFEVGENVFVRSVRKEKVNWLPGKVIKCISPVTYLIKEGNRTRFVHADHLRKNLTKEEEHEEWLLPEIKEPEIRQTTEPTEPRSPQKHSPKHRQSIKSPLRPSTTISPPKPQAMLGSPRKSLNQNFNDGQLKQGEDTEAIRRSQRTRRAPDKMNL
ncbi:uncharacterized protein K02A2.6-like [Macrosteles quadrilineatus]|uniref:uncharacterized protein K02A2.6-like n=1 Tax=Macrosteles quadrilineatus TaxID=74068 RepID=UPI0023E125AF|nr:uncharacterized protein K02A2.6-like [Macrosteles quadrilineatus]